MQAAPSHKVITWQSGGHVICYDDGADFHNLGWARVKRQQQQQSVCFAYEKWEGLILGGVRCGHESRLRQYMLRVAPVSK